MGTTVTVKKSDFIDAMEEKAKAEIIKSFLQN